MDDEKRVAIWEYIDRDFAKKCDDALAEYRTGLDEVNIRFGELFVRLFDRKDNDDRETVRMTMEELLGTLRACHVNGAALAASIIAQSVAGLAGLAVVDEAEAEVSEEPSR
jgi:hypothetical protein